MNQMKLKAVRHNRRKQGIRNRILGVPGRPRMTIFRSAKHIYVQVIDDLRGHTVVSASTAEKAFDGRGSNCDAAKKVGEAIASRAKGAGVEKVVFDRNGFRYHGRIKALADSARKAGLQF